MARDLSFSPIIFIKEKDGTSNSAIVVDNGPRLMEDSGDDVRKYSPAFNDLIEEFPTILSATFYGRNYTSYRIKIEGEDPKSLIGIKKFIMEYGED